MNALEQINVESDISQEFSGLPDEWIVLAETSAEKTLGNSLSMIKYLVNDKDYVGIIVSASRPYNNLANIYQQKGIDTNKILFIDCISKSQSVELEEAGNVVYQEAVSDLTNISLSIKTVMDKIPEKKFVFIDSITTMLIHNTSEIFARFIHGMITKLRIKGVSGLLLSVEEETDEHIRFQIADLCDKVIKV
ncbi:MAG: ATPase domain-containing protein [Candidatus Thermoplasmatota archaeon]|nr:ATPase domain-containing protein [Candidatus Thermoplasmatota archaeon]